MTLGVRNPTVNSAAASYSTPRRFAVLPVLVAMMTFFGASALAGGSPARAAGSPPAPAVTGFAKPVSAVNGFTMEQLPASQLNLQLSVAQAYGVTVVRADAPWADIEPSPPTSSGHSWQFGATDAWVTALAVHHLAWQPIIDYSVWWAKTCPGFCAPTTDASYATFAQAVAARYGVHGSFWASHPTLPYYPAQIFEIWNEEGDQEFWVPPARYATMYLAARQAIHVADPSGIVITGGLADDSGPFNRNTDYPAWYVQDMFAADPGLKGNIDGFGLHPYGSSAIAVMQWVEHFRSVLATLGEGSAPIYVTEVGWPTGTSVTESWRASQMAALASTLGRSNCGISLVAPYDWIDPGAPSDGDFGLVDQSGSSPALRAAGSAWFGGLRQAASASPVALCPTTMAPVSVTASVGPLVRVGGHQANRRRHATRRHRPTRRSRRRHVNRRYPRRQTRRNPRTQNHQSRTHRRPA